MYKQGDIVAVNYPFSDQPAKIKLRPAVIVSNSASNSEDNDFLICPITTTIRNENFSFILKEDYLKESLPYRSEVRCNKITTIRNSLILGKVTEIREEFLLQLTEKIKGCF